MLLRDAVRLFLGEYKPSTRESYSFALRLMMDYIGPSRHLTNIRPEHLVEYAQTLKKRKYSPATELKHIKTIKTFFNWVVKLELLVKSPAKPLRQKKLPNYIEKDKAMTDRELSAILEYVRWKPRDYALIMFLADTGCRAGGAADLQVKDLDISNRRAYVTEKGDKSRLVAFGDDCAESLARWLLQRPANAGPYVFTRNGKPIKSDNISQIIRRACKKVGIRSLGSHSLRHRKGHQLADNKVAPSVAATALGHSDPAITLQHYYPRDWERAEIELQKLTVKLRQEEKTLIEFPKSGSQ